MIKKICSVCGHEFIAKKKSQKYCSLACFGLTKRKKIDKQYCAVCGKEIEPDFSKGQKLKKYCSQKCYKESRNDYYKYHQDEFEICGNFVIVKNNKFKVLLDKEDFFKLKHKIIVQKRNEDTTAYAFINLEKTVRLHRFILNCPDNMVVDHINHNGLDNRKCNLRIVTIRENTLNRQLSKNNKSGVIGVCFKKNDRVWEAYYCNKYLGRFKNKKDAIKARIDYIKSQEHNKGIITK